MYVSKRGSANYGDGNWQGFQGADMEVTFELVNLQKVKKITVSFLDNNKAWIYLSAMFEVYASSDGKDFKKIGTLTKEEIKGFPEDEIKNISISFDNVEVKYVRIFAKNSSSSPEADPGGGVKAWIFCDEVKIE